jgi:hypothetical protein
MCVILMVHIAFPMLFDDGCCDRVHRKLNSVVNIIEVADKLPVILWWEQLYDDIIYLWLLVGLTLIIGGTIPTSSWCDQKMKTSFSKHFYLCTNLHGILSLKTGDLQDLPSCLSIIWDSAICNEYRYGKKNEWNNTKFTFFLLNLTTFCYYTSVTDFYSMNCLLWIL